MFIVFVCLSFILLLSSSISLVQHKQTFSSDMGWNTKIESVARSVTRKVRSVMPDNLFRQNLFYTVRNLPFVQTANGYPFLYTLCSKPSSCVGIHILCSFEHTKRNLESIFGRKVRTIGFYSKRNIVSLSLFPQRKFTQTTFFSSNRYAIYMASTHPLFFRIK